MSEAEEDPAPAAEEAPPEAPVEDDKNEEFEKEEEEQEEEGDKKKTLFLILLLLCCCLVVIIIIVAVVVAVKKNSDDGGTGEWIQIGPTIEGEEDGDQLGESMALSADGKTVVVALPGYDTSQGTGIDAGIVRIYRLGDDGSLVQLGDDLPGDWANDRFGHSVSISADGNIVAIGAPFNSFNLVTNQGQVQAFQYDADEDSWITRGGKIQGGQANAALGYSVALSGTGAVMAAGMPTTNFGGPGRVRIFKYDGLAWFTNPGNPYFEIVGESSGDLFGSSLAINNAGTRVAVGAIYNDGGGSNSGHIRVYQDDGSGDWEQLGRDIDGLDSFEEFGTQIAFDAGGTCLVAGAPKEDKNPSVPGVARVYCYDGQDWVRTGGDIVGATNGDAFGKAVDITDDGTRIIVGAPLSNATGIGGGRAVVYELSGDVWEPVGLPVDGPVAGSLTGTSVTISGDGETIAVGSPAPGAGNATLHQID